MRRTFDLIMPMAGRGSRFSAAGMSQPKPLLDLAGRPFFWWAVESFRRAASVGSMVFIVLEEHVAEWNIDRRILDFYPEAHIVCIPEVTSGSAETAHIGISALDSDNAIAINDCDHAFVTPDLTPTLHSFDEAVAGSLMTFHSANPSYSYVELSEVGNVCGTVEKRVVSPFAIAGCYLFGNKQLFESYYETYVKTCPYKELFLSGVYNEMLKAGETITMTVLERHFAFGTHEEYKTVAPQISKLVREWAGPA